MVGCCAKRAQTGSPPRRRNWRIAAARKKILPQITIHIIELPPMKSQMVSGKKGDKISQKNYSVYTYLYKRGILPKKQGFFSALLKSQTVDMVCNGGYN